MARQEQNDTERPGEGTESSRLVTGAREEQWHLSELNGGSPNDVPMVQPPKPVNAI